MVLMISTVSTAILPPAACYHRRAPPLSRSQRGVSAAGWMLSPPSPGAPGSAEPASPRRVLSLQSHVVRGHVGNAAAVFPLQLLGFDVDPINSVQFSNHTGYPAVRGERLGAPQLEALLEGLRLNGLLAGAYSHLLSGYVGAAPVLLALAKAAAELTQLNPGLVFVCDPVMGDNGRLYVSPESVAVYRDALVPLAHVLTPNAFEAALLTGLPVTTAAQALAACDALHGRGPHTVVVTSLEEEGEGAAAAATPAEPPPTSAPPPPPPPPPSLLLVASTTLAQLAGRPARFCVRVPKLAGSFTGTGDLLAALLLAHWHAAGPWDLATAVERAVAGVQGVLGDTARAAAVGSGAAAPPDSPAGRAPELLLVRGARHITHPEVVHAAQPL